MAQVKKFQSGGGLYLDGVKLTDEQINAAMGSLSAEDKYTWSKSIDRVRAGERVDLNELANSVSGGDFSHVLNERQLEKNASGNLNRRQRDRHARRGSDIDSTNRGIANGISALKAQLHPKEETPTETQSLNRGSGWFSFGDDGVYNEGPQNLTNEKIIRDAFAWLGGDENYRKGWTVSGYDNNETLNGLSNWYKGQNADELIGRIKNGTLSEDDYEVLAALGFQKDGNVPTSSTSKTSHVDWKGNADAASRAGVYFTKDKDGNWFLNNTGDSSDYLGNVWYNGGLDFLAGTEFADGMIGADGRLYTRADILGGKYQDSRVNAFLSAQNQNGWRNWYDAANASGVRFTGDRISTGGASDNYGVFNTQFNPNTHYNEYWSDYFTSLGGNNPYDIADISNNFGNLNGRQVIAYIDPTGTKDAMGIRGVKYVVRNTDGTYSSAYDNEAALMQGTGLTAPTQWWTPAPGEFNQNVWETIGNKQYSLAHELNTQGDQQNVIMRGKDGNWYLARKSGDVHVKPKLIKNIELLNQILANPQNYKTSDIENLTEGSGVNMSQSRAFARRQDGGTIPKIKELPKFQYGGAVGKSNTKSEVKSTDGLRTDVTSTHKINGEDGGLTKAEKLQIAAAIGDLAGVGLSFAPGVGNVAGATIGLGSTATRLVADIKKDGFQAKDAWSAAGGALLDLATIIPGLGTGAKTAKAVKAIKAAATPIMKVLSLAGAAQGVAAMGKVIRGEEITSEDLTAIISGLGSTAIAGKQLKDTIGDAKLAKKLATNAAQSANAVNDSELVGTTLQKTRKEIANLIGDTKSEKEVVGKVQELLKQTNPEATTADARKVLQEWGVETSRSRFSGKDGWKEYLKFWKKGEKQVSFDLPKEQEAGSTLYYMLNPYARLKQTGFDWGIASSKGNLGILDKSEIAAAERMLNNGSRSALAQSIARHTVNNPSAINVELEQIATRRRPGKWGWPVYMRGVKQTLPQQEIKILALDAPQQMLMLPAPKQTAPQPSQILMLPAPKQNLPDPSYSRSILYRSLDEGWNPRVSTEGYPLWAQRWDDVYIDPTLPSNYYQLNGLVDPIKFNSFQKGGKIQKAKGGLNMMNIIKNSGLTLDLNALSTSPTNNGSINKDGIIQSNVVSQMLAQQEREASNSQPIKAFNPVTNYAVDHSAQGSNPTYATKYMEIPEIEASSITAEVKTPTKVIGNPYGETRKSGSFGAMASALGGVASNYALATRANRQQLDLAKDTYNSTLRNLETNTPEFYNRYQDAGIGNGYEKAAASLMSNVNKAIYSDPTLNEAVRMNAAEQAAGYLATGEQAKSQAYQNWMNQDNELRRAYAAERTAVENRNRQRIAQAEAYLNQQKGASIAQQSAINQGAMADLGKIVSIPRQTKLEQQYTDASRNYQDWLTKAKADYNTGIDNNTITAGTTFDSWISSDANMRNKLREYQDILSGITAKSKYLQFKSGGSVRHRPEAEQKRIDQQKIVANAVKQLSKQAFEFLKMALS